VLVELSAALAAIPACMFVWNWFVYRPPSQPRAGACFPVSVLIPARNEEDSIANCVRSVLASRNVDVEVLVLDDHSDDATASVVEQIAREDSRVRVVPAPTLPAAWCGKQHACWILSQLATRPISCFIDADVQVEADCIASLANELRAHRLALLSGFPRQRTETFVEGAVIPLMHFLLLGFLPMWFMRLTSRPSFGAGCGQMFVADRDAYRHAGGHAAIRASRHDGVTLPKAFRRAGFMTGLFDITHLASCRMYKNGTEVISGLSKNATEGLAAPARIVPFTSMLFGGQILPFILLATSPSRLAITAVALSYLPRVLATIRFRQSWIGTLFHPVGVLILLAIQWLALIRCLLGISSTWKGRTYPAGAAS
jgi:Glycosyl transferase family 2